jgi:hypothetical protein
MKTRQAKLLRVLRSVYEYFEDPRHFTIGVLASDANGDEVSPASRKACKHCLIGAGMKFGRYRQVFNPFTDFLTTLLPPSWTKQFEGNAWDTDWEMLSEFSDRHGRPAVRRLLRKAIKQLTS